MRNRLRTAVVGTTVLAASRAGAHSNFTLHVAFPDTGTDVKDLTIHLPPGMVGDPTATPFCTVAQLNADTCPANTQVGAVTTAVTVTVVPPIGLPLTVDGTLYNLTPQTGEPARFGIVLRPVGGALPKIVLQSAVKLRTTDYGLDTVINNIPNTASGLATHIDSMDVQLQGMAGSPANPFMRNPTSCTVATTTFDAVSYSAATATGTASFTPTNCGALDFSPTFSAQIGSGGHTDPGTSPPLTTVVEQDIGEAGVNQVSVVLPDGIAAQNAPLGRTCTVAAFQAGTCPTDTIVGDARATSTLLTQPLTGPVAVITPESVGTLPRLGLDLQGPLHIQLFGKFTLSANGRPTFATTFTGWNGAVQSGDVAATVQGCGSTGGGGRPKAKVVVSRAKTHKPRLRLKVSAGAAKLKKAKLRLPKQLHFANGRTFYDGFTVSVANGGPTTSVHSARSVTVAKPTGLTKLVEKARKGALLHRHKIAGKKLHFKLGVTDANGKTTKLKLTTKAKP